MVDTMNNCPPTRYVVAQVSKPADAAEKPGRQRIGIDITQLTTSLITSRDVPVKVGCGAGAAGCSNVLGLEGCESGLPQGAGPVPNWA